MHPVPHCTYIHTPYTHTHHTRMHACIHTHTHTLACTHKHTRVHTHTMLHALLYTHLLLCLRPARTHSNHSVTHWQLTTCVRTEKTKDPKKSNLRLRRALRGNNQATQVHTLQSHYLPLPSPMTTACNTVN